MRLRNKLFFSTGLLLVLLGLLFFLSFIYFFQNDLETTKAKIASLFSRERRHEAELEMSLLKERVLEEKERINALFEVLQPEPKPLSTLTSILATHPDIGFAQLRKIDSPKAFTLIPSNVPFHAVSTFAMNDKFFFVVLENSSNKIEEDNLYLAYPISATIYATFPTYLLFSWKEVSKEIKDFLGAFDKKTPVSLPQPPSANIPDTPEKNEREKIGLLKTFAPFFEKGVEIFPGKGKLKPEGIALLSSNGKGKALLASDLFHVELFFDDKSYYEKHRPSSSFFSVAEGEALITTFPGEIYVGNTSLYENYLLTLGFPLSPMIKTFATTTHQKVILATNGVQLGFNSEGKKLGQEDLKSILGHRENLSHLEIFPPSDLTLYVEPTIEEEKVLFRTLDLLNDTLLHKLSWQMVLIVLALLILALIVLNYLSGQFIKPISRLVNIANTIKSGKLKEVAIPPASNNNDELAQLTNAFKGMIVELQEKERIRSLLNKVVSKEIAEEILKSDVHLGGEDRVITVLFADIRNFTELSQHLPPQKTVAILNIVMTMVSKIIESEGGVIDKYIGDEVMALFGAPITHPDHALRALSTAKLIIETLRKWNKEREERGETAVEIGIGINTGLVVAGNMGAEDRLNYTVVGPSVNLASRLCKAAAPMQVIVSEFTLEEPAIKDSFYVESLPPVTLKGFSDPVKAFQVTGFKWESI